MNETIEILTQFRKSLRFLGSLQPNEVRAVLAAARYALGDTTFTDEILSYFGLTSERLAEITDDLRDITPLIDPSYNCCDEEGNYYPGDYEDDEQIVYAVRDITVNDLFGDLQPIFSDPEEVLYKRGTPGIVNVGSDHPLLEPPNQFIYVNFQSEDGSTEEWAVHSSLVSIEKPDEEEG